MKKYFLTSVLLAGFIAPAYAADDNFITGGANTCTVDVLKVSDNNATANTIAVWTANNYTLAPGKRLNITATDIETVDCDAGSYCPGGEYTVETASNAIKACPEDYTSDAGAAGENECYMGCELACSTNVECPAHSTNCRHSEFKTTGKQFFDATCNAYPSVCPIADFQCDMGYNKSTVNIAELFLSQTADTMVANTLLECSIVGQDATSDEIIMVSLGLEDFPDNGINDCDIVPPGTSLLMIDGYLITMEVTANDYGSDTSGIVLKETYGELYPYPYQFRYLPNANFESGIHSDKETFNMWGTFTKIGVPTLATHVLEDAFNEFESSGSLSNDTLNKLQTNLSQDAWLALQELLGKVQSGAFVSEEQIMREVLLVYIKTLQQVSTNMPWVLISGDIEYSKFEEGIVENKATPVLFYLILGFTGLDLSGDVYDTLFDLIDANVSYCANNKININWNADNGTASVQNMCYYDGEIKVPSDPVKPGYTFTGWKLVE